MQVGGHWSDVEGSERLCMPNLIDATKGPLHNGSTVELGMTWQG